AALRRLLRDPGFLERVARVGRQALDGGYRLAGGVLDRDEAGESRLAVHVHGARAALPRAAAVLGAGQAQLLAQHPQQGRIRVSRDGAARTVDGERRIDHLRQNASSSHARPAPRRRLWCYRERRGILTQTNRGWLMAKVGSGRITA